MSSASARYFMADESVATDPVSGTRPVKLKYCAGGEWKES